MFKRSHILYVGIISFSLVAGLVAGSMSFGTPSATAKGHPNTELLNNLKYKVNQHGLTYGSAMNATSVEDQPDLILAKGTDGTSGYIKREDLNKDQPNNPQEALEYMEKLKNGPTYFEIPLYAADGETVIGKFKMLNPASKGGQEIIEKQNADAAAAAGKDK